MSFAIDPKLFELHAHNPSFGALKRELPAQQQQQLIDFYVPANGYFPTPAMHTSLREQLAEALTYYPDQNQSLSQIMANLLKIDTENIVMANGSTELITWIDRLFIKNTLLTDIPTFGRWIDKPMESGKTVHYHTRLPENNFQIVIEEFVSQVKHCHADTVVICNPNNPTGAYLPKQAMIQLLDKLSTIKLVVIDESFIDFAALGEQASMQKEAIQRPNVIVLKSLGKSLGMHGIRLGYAVTNPSLALQLRNALPYWNVNGIAEMVMRLLSDYWHEFQNSRQQVMADRNYLQQCLQTLTYITVYPSHANFVYIKVHWPISGTALRNQLAQQYGYIIRECANKKGANAQYCRIAAKSPQHTDKLIAALASTLQTLYQEVSTRE